MVMQFSPNHLKVSFYCDYLSEVMILYIFSESFIHSANYPDDYPNNYKQVNGNRILMTPLRLNWLLQTWELQSTNGQAITLTFDSFYIFTYDSWDGTCVDWVDIDDGSSIQRHCGVSIPGPFTSTGTINVTLNTGSLFTASGFLATVCCSVRISVSTETELTIGKLKNIVKLRQGSGKDRQGMVTKRPLMAPNGLKGLSTLA